MLNENYTVVIVVLVCNTYILIVFFYLFLSFVIVLCMFVVIKLITNH